MPRRACLRLLEPGRERRGAAADVREPDRDLPLQPLLELADGRRGAASSPSLGTRRSARVSSSRRSTSEPGTAASARSGSSDGGEAASTTQRWSRSHPSLAARPSSQAATRRARACSKKSLIRFFSVSRSIRLDLLERDGGLVGFAARARSTSDVPVAARSPSSSSLATSGGDGRRAAAARGSGPAREDDLAACRRLRARTPAGAAPRRRGRAGRGARLGAQELPRPRGDGRKHGVERLGARQDLPELGQVLELVDAASHLLVESGVLDRAGDERRARDEHLLGLAELRGASVWLEMTPMTFPSLPTIGTETRRLEALLLELGNVLHARVRGSVANPGWLLVLGGPPGRPFPAQRDLPTRCAYGSEAAASTSRSSSTR